MRHARDENPIMATYQLQGESAYGVSASSSTLQSVISDTFPNTRVQTRRALAGAARLRNFDADQVILAQGDGSHLALILGGHAAVIRTTAEGHQRIIRLLGRSELAAMMPFASIPTTGDVVALGPTPVALWTRGDVRSLAMVDPGLGVDLLDRTLAGAERAIEHQDELRSPGAIARVARVLSRHSDLFFGPEPVLTRAHLPILVGTSREMTGRVLRVLESRRIVARVGRNRLRLLDRKGLAVAAGVNNG
jgi:CRP-like cAMP-binding protein